MESDRDMPEWFRIIEHHADKCKDESGNLDNAQFMRRLQLLIVQLDRENITPRQYVEMYMDTGLEVLPVFPGGIRS